MCVRAPVWDGRFEGAAKWPVRVRALHGTHICQQYGSPWATGYLGQFLKISSLLSPPFAILFGPRQANLVLIAYASSEGSGEPAHPRSLARTFAARWYKQWVKRNLQTESQFPSPSEWLGMRSWNLSWRNARRHKFAWRGSFGWKAYINSKANGIYCENACL